MPRARWMPICSLILLVVSATAGAVGSSISAEYEYHGPSHIADLEDASPLDPTTVQQSRIGVRYTLPLWILGGGKRIFASTLAGDVVSLAYEDLPSASGPEGVDSFYGARYTLSWIENYSERVKTILNLTPGIAYDGEETSSDIFLMQGDVSIWKVFGDGWDVGIGGGVLNEFGEPKFLPVFGVRHHSGPTGRRPEPGTHLVDLILPVMTSYYYVVSESVHAGAVYKVAGSEYRLTAGSLQDHNVKYSNATIGPSIRFLVGDHGTVELGGGYVFSRHFEVFDGDDSVGDFDLENRGYARVSAGFTF